MTRNLVIVESPAKAKTIEKYLGKDFRVMSSIGHIRSIAKKTKDGKNAIDVSNGFETVYEVDPEKKKVISELKKSVKESEQVWLATDEDREGEAIAWHLCEVLNLDPKTTKRIVFHEITKSAIEEAVKTPRTVDMQLVQAQQARQILDRLVGFELSPVIWQKVPGGKSAGRVQSPAVRLLVEREREIESFEGSFQFKVTAEFLHKGQTVKAELPNRFDSEKEATKFLESIKDARFTVSDVAKTPGTRNPGPPFTTSTLQQEANSKLGFGTRATMSSAQKLYQSGKITYMRTDSTVLSGQAIAAASNFIKSKYGEQYSTIRQFKTKNSSAQEAHEAIRPTDMGQEKGSSNEYDQKIYDLIRRRTLASQMASAQLEKTTVTISIEPRVAVGGAAPKNVFDDKQKILGADHPTGSVSANTSYFEAKGEVILFDGFLKVYGGGKKDPDLLPAMKSGDSLALDIAEAKQTFKKPPARYTEGSLVKKLEELGIGRPSTYATIINTIQVREYAVKGENEGQERDVIVLSTSKPKRVAMGGAAPTSDIAAGDSEEGADPSTGPVSSDLRGNSEGISNDGSGASTEKVGSIYRSVVKEKTGSDRGKLVPTAIGMMISDFLTDYFDKIVDYGFTADVEEDFDKIATGALARNVMLERFYIPFHKLVEGSGKIERSAVAQATPVGTDPKSGKMIYARFGRYGPMLQLGETEDEEKPTFAPMPRGARIETVTLDQALKAFELPRIVGTTEDGKEIKANIGRFGPYIQVDKLFVSIKPLDPHDITLEQARQLYVEKLKTEAEKNIADFGDGVKVLNGRFGPYVTDGKKNAKIPKGTDPKQITHDDAKKLLSAAPTTKKRIPKRRKKS